MLKIIIFSIFTGLERVAEELMGRKKWSTSQSKPTTLGEADGIDKISELQMNENLTGSV